MVSVSSNQTLPEMCFVYVLPLPGLGIVVDGPFWHPLTPQLIYKIELLLAPFPLHPPPVLQQMTEGAWVWVSLCRLSLPAIQ